VKADACPGLCWGQNDTSMATSESSTMAEKRQHLPGMPDSLVKDVRMVKWCPKLGWWWEYWGQPGAVAGTQQWRTLA